MLNKTIIRRLALTTLFTLAFPALTEESSKAPVSYIHLASTEWCPYVCDDEANPGFIVKFMRALLAEQNIELDVTVLPWSRAIRQARKGAYDGLLTAVESEASDFSFSRVPTGYYQICLFGSENSDHRFTDRASLKGLRIAGIQDYGYGEPLDSVLREPSPDETVYLLSGSQALEQLTGMLKRNRIDLFAEDKNVVEKFQNDREGEPILSIAGCLDEVPFYTAISPENPAASQWIAVLESALRSDIAKTLYMQSKDDLISSDTLNHP